MKRGLIFDLDGTLWDSTGVIRPVWNRVLEENGHAALSEAEFASLMGLTKREIAANAMPDAEENDRLHVVEQCFAAEQIALRAQGGRLYPDLRETLELLHGRYFLAIVSNCAPAYLEAFFAAHGLRELFDDWETHGATGLTKGENIRLAFARNTLDCAVFIGDTVSDWEAARAAGLPFIHAAYGFGHVPEAKLVIHGLAELPGLIEKWEGGNKACL